MDDSFYQVHWFVSQKKSGITYYLKEMTEHSRTMVWTKRRENAIKYTSSGDAQRVVDQIKIDRDNKKLQIKVV